MTGEKTRGIGVGMSGVGAEVNPPGASDGSIDIGLGVVSSRVGVAELVDPLVGSGVDSSANSLVDSMAAELVLSGPDGFNPWLKKGWLTKKHRKISPKTTSASMAVVVNTPFRSVRFFFTRQPIIDLFVPAAVHVITR
jgi:hypothetical protein